LTPMFLTSVHARIHCSDQAGVVHPLLSLLQQVSLTCYITDLVFDKLCIALSSGGRNVPLVSATADAFSSQMLPNRLNASTRSSVERPASAASAITTGLRHTVQWPIPAFDDNEMRPNEAMLFERLERARSDRSNNDRWTQARERRRELQNALLAEESRMPVLRRGSRSQ
jgi:hypothetical protein